jgi:hypothetical protein
MGAPLFLFHERDKVIFNPRLNHRHRGVREPFRLKKLIGPDGGAIVGIVQGTAEGINEGGMRRGSQGTEQPPRFSGSNGKERFAKEGGNARRGIEGIDYANRV